MTTDVILGMGEVGSTLFQLLTERGFHCFGIDKISERCKGEQKSEISFLHVCFPMNDDFQEIITENIRKFNPQAVMIHSTVRPNTTTRIQEIHSVPIIYSPVRGVHSRFLEDMKRYSKFYACNNLFLESRLISEIQKRFPNTKRQRNTLTLEYAKLLVDTTYYGYLINYAQMTKMICDKNNIEYDEMWEFADEIHQYLGNRPKLFAGVIGGHCVIPNLDLLNDSTLGLTSRIESINTLFENHLKKQQ